MFVACDDSSLRCFEFDNVGALEFIFRLNSDLCCGEVLKSVGWWLMDVPMLISGRPF